MGVTLTDVLLFGKAQSDDVDNATLVIYRRNILRWSALGGYLDIIVKDVSPLSLPDAIANSLQYVKAFGGTEQNGTPTPDAPVDIVCNNGVIKVFAGNKFTTDGVATGYIISSYTGEINQNANYNVTDYIYLLAGDYTGTFFDDGTGNRYFRCWSYNIDDGTPIRAIFNIQTTSGLTTFNFSVSENCYVRASYRNNFTQMTMSPTPPIVYADGTVETINAHGKNLIKMPTYEEAKHASQVVNYFNIPIKLEPNTTYYLSTRYLNGYESKGKSIFVLVTANAIENKDYLCIAHKTVGIRNGDITTGDSGFLYLRINVGVDKNLYNEMFMNTEVQLERGSTATAYEPYYNGGTATCEPLLSIGNYTDVQEILSGNITRNVGVKVLDGTESWTASGSAGRYFTYIADMKSFSERTEGFCTHYSYAGSGAVHGTYFLTNAKRVFVYTNYETASEFQAFLASQYAAGTPVIIVYPLATPTTEVVARQTLQVTQGDNVLEITQASIDGLELEAKYQAAVSLTIQEVQDANLDPNVEVTIQ